MAMAPAIERGVSALFVGVSAVFVNVLGCENPRAFVARSSATMCAKLVLPAYRHGHSARLQYEARARSPRTRSTLIPETRVSSRGMVGTRSAESGLAVHDSGRIPLGGGDADS